MTKLIALFTVVSCFLNSRLVATTTIPVSPGPPGIDHFVFDLFNDINGTRLNGQPLSLDFVFPSNEFIRLFTASNGFSVSLDLILGNPSPGLTPYSGSAYLLDSLGAHVSPQRSLILTPGTNQQGNLIIAGFVFRPSSTDGSSSASLITPVDFYGVHFDLFLPNTATTVITTSHIAFSDGGFGFGVGPDAPLPIDVVPESGNSFVMLTVAVAAIFSIRTLRGDSVRYRHSASHPPSLTKRAFD